MEYFHNYRLSIRISSVKSGRKKAVHSMSVNVILTCVTLVLEISLTLNFTMLLPHNFPKFCQIPLKLYVFQ